MKVSKEIKEKLVITFGKDWCEALKDIILSQSFFNLSSIIKQERQNHTIYPESFQVFRAFRETGYIQTKVLLLGQDPYHDGTASGLSFCCRDSHKTNPSLRLILKEIDLEYPENKDRIDFGRLDKADLSRWAKQGVLMLNAALTVRAKQPGGHQKLWTGFTSKVLHKISGKKDVVFILLGKDAQKYKPYIKPTGNLILEAPHPAAEIYKPGIGFIGSGIFKKANEFLNSVNKKEIEW